MSSDFCLELLRQDVRNYRSQPGSAVRDELKDCEKFLDQGIRIFAQLQRYEEAAQEAARRGIPVSDDVPSIIERLYREWLEQCGRAEEMIVALDGDLPRNISEFHKAAECVRNRIATFDHFATLNEALSGRLFTNEYIQEVEQAISR